jgi:hypothetical protein
MSLKRKRATKALRANLAAWKWLQAFKRSLG